MRTVVRALEAAAVLAAGTVLIATAVKPQAPARGPAAWEYATVLKANVYANDRYTNGTNADICYATSDGCRSERVTARKDNQDSSNVDPDAVMKAAGDLGAQGWELVTVSEGKLYFRRPRNSPR